MNNINNTNYSNSNFMQVLGQTGWICPICKKVNAPWIQQCPCNGMVDWETTVAVDWTHHDTKSDGTITMSDIDKINSGKHAKLDYTQNTTAYYDAATRKTTIMNTPQNK